MLARWMHPIPNTIITPALIFKPTKYTCYNYINNLSFSALQNQKNGLFLKIFLPFAKNDSRKCCWKIAF
jgi:hypothetical protein